VTELPTAAAHDGAGTGPGDPRPGSRAVNVAWLLGGFCLTLIFTVQLFRYGDEWCTSLWGG